MKKKDKKIKYKTKRCSLCREVVKIREESYLCSKCSPLDMSERLQILAKNKYRNVGSGFFKEVRAKRGFKNSNGK